MELTIDLNIQKQTGRNFQVCSILPQETIYEIKNRIQKLKGIAIEQQVLTISGSNQFIKDQTKLCDIPQLVSASIKVLKLQVYYKMITLLIIQGKSKSDLKIKTYPCSSISEVKSIIEKHTGISSLIQTLSYNGVIMENDKILADYNLKDSEDYSMEDANSTTTLSRPFEICLFVRKGEKSKISLGIDFSFNIIKDVKKMGWKSSAPWYRELSDGLSWFCYCRNLKCNIADELFKVVSLQYEVPSLL